MEIAHSARVLSEAEGPGLEHYLSKFKSVDPHRFAVIKVSGECIQNDLERMVKDLADIQGYGLQPVVCIGWGKILDKKMKDAGIDPVKIDGLRYTDAQVLDKITEAVLEIKHQFLGYALKHKLLFTDLTSPIFTVDPMDTKYGFVGNATGVNIDMIAAACASGSIPLIAPLGRYNGQTYNINGDTASSQLVRAINPLKYIAVTGTGGILDRNGHLIPRVSILDDYEALTSGAHPIVREGMLLKLNEAKGVLETFRNGGNGNGYCVEFTSPKTLLQEIFTYRGAGTKVTHGYETRLHPWPNGVNLVAANDLIHRVSGKNLVDDYWKNEPIVAVIDEVDDCAGIAVLEMHNGWTYMDKFYVNFGNQATGLGSKIFNQAWDYTQQNAPTKGMFWRAAIDNSNVNWYTNKMLEYAKLGIDCGCETRNGWFICWFGGDRSQVEEVVNYAANKPKTLIERT